MLDLLGLVGVLLFSIILSYFKLLHFVKIFFIYFLCFIGCVPHFVLHHLDIYVQFFGCLKRNVSIGILQGLDCSGVYYAVCGWLNTSPASI